MGSQRRWWRRRPRDRWSEGAGRRWAEPDGRAGAPGGRGRGHPAQLPTGTRGAGGAGPGVCALLRTWMPAWSALQAGAGGWVRQGGARGCGVWGPPRRDPLLGEGGGKDCKELEGVLPIWFLGPTLLPNPADPWRGKGPPGSESGGSQTPPWAVGGSLGDPGRVGTPPQASPEWGVGAGDHGRWGASPPHPCLPPSLPPLLYLEIIFKCLFCASQRLGSPLRGGFQGNNNWRLPRGESALPWQPHPFPSEVRGGERRGWGWRLRCPLPSTALSCRTNGSHLAASQPASQPSGVGEGTASPCLPRWSIGATGGLDWGTLGGSDWRGRVAGS